MGHDATVPGAAPHAAELQTLIRHARRVSIDGAMLPLPDQMPERFAGAVREFLEKQ